MDCNTGDLLCLASMPAYDPNSFADGISHSEWQMFAADERKPLLNKALNALYPPGSTMKPSVAMALLENGIDPEERVSCGGGYQLGNRFFRCLGRHGPMNLHTAIARSCNTYFYAMGRRIGFDKIAPVARALGLGQRFDLPVVSQSFGTIPDSEWKQRRAAQNPKAFHRPDWTESDTLNASIGQGYVILNPLQLGTMAACVASGKKIRPRLIAGEGDEPEPLPYAAESFRHRCGPAWTRWSTATAPPVAAACPSPTSAWAARPAPPRCGGSPAASAARAATGAIATTACSSSSRRWTGRFTPARW